MPGQVRLPHSARLAIITDAAVKVANEDGLDQVSHQKVADACSVETSFETVRHYAPRKNDLYVLVLESGKRLNKKVTETAKAMGLIK